MAIPLGWLWLAGGGDDAVRALSPCGVTGRGGMSEVWRAHDTAANNRGVAIKLLPAHLADDETLCSGSAAKPRPRRS